MCACTFMWVGGTTVRSTCQTDWPRKTLLGERKMYKVYTRALSMRYATYAMHAVGVDMLELNYIIIMQVWAIMQSCSCLINVC